MSRILILAIIIASIGFVLYQISTFLFSINNTKSQKRRDISKLKKDLQPRIDSLIKLDDDELELLSINVSDVARIPGIEPEILGVFTSIYHEPLIAFAQKSYVGGQASVTLVFTSNHEFVYQSDGAITTVNVDGQDIGSIHSDGNLYDMKDRQVAYIAADDVLATHPVRVGQREVGEIINPGLASSPNPRAYTFLEPMDRDEKVLFMSLTLLSLVEESI